MYVASLNALWHIDGLHCLIRWRMVIHGGIDGYSRRIVYTHASNNNRASTVFNLFLDATRICGWPSRVRSDCGGENVDVTMAMIMCRGMGRSSHISGSSVHNQWIERLWRDTFTCVCHTFYNLFYEMGDSGLLSPTDKHLFCIHYIFLPRINLQLQQFMDGWNNHSLRTESGLTPLQLWTRGMSCQLWCTAAAIDVWSWLWWYSRTSIIRPSVIQNLDYPIRAWRSIRLIRTSAFWTPPLDLCAREQHACVCPYRVSRALSLA